MSKAFLHRAIVLIVVLATGLQTASAHAEPVPFKATYALAIDGWPDARIRHRLSRQGEVWQSEMNAAIAVAEGDERSRFRLEGELIEAEAYASGYRFLSFGERYRLSADELTHLPDRQTALFILSRQVDKARCTHNQVAPCTLRFLNYKGEETLLKYRVVDRDQARLPAGTFPRIVIDAWNPEKSDRHLIMGFHPEIPGLLLSLEYRREGERKSRLVLSQLTLVEPGDQQP
ncbi:hypothetical protein SAMN02745148_02126 [Modicisalibacter ilicicola DSM 19980]|uniref:DUF3108 domain-containing protein n=1 Tax=Modicisalibacter ilicicola DSM 19980 TaxID=1121942 RepID=A0A1M4ZZW6_9GAMM|nr:hypothetical protein [Halomonas ilicicola]SHF23569.1 hypothetical protein SAMN02745148_02126 [Halomonas ilicicola DSM 19980]